MAQPGIAAFLSTPHKDNCGEKLSGNNINFNIERVGRNDIEGGA